MKLLNKSSALSMIAAAVITAGSVVGYAQTTSTTPAASAPATRAAPTEFIAKINGRPIPRADFTDALIQIGGLRLLDEYWSFAVTMEACEAAGITLRQDVEIKAAKDLILKRVVAEADLKTLNALPAKDAEAQKDTIIVQVLAKQGVASALQADWTIKTLAGLQALAVRNPDQIIPTADEMSKAMAVAYAQKATVRDFYGLKAFEDAAKLRGLLKDGKKVEEITGYQARDITLSKGDPNLPSKFKDAVFAAGMKDGSYTAPLSEEIPKEAVANAPLPAWHVLVIIKAEDAQKEPVGAELEKFKAAVADQKLAMWRQQHLNKLKSISKVEIIDPILLQQAVQIEKMKQANAEAATRPTVPVPTTGPTTLPGVPAATMPK